MILYFLLSAHGFLQAAHPTPLFVFLYFFVFIAKLQFEPGAQMGGVKRKYNELSEDDLADFV